jgi:hypothetical protein
MPKKSKFLGALALVLAVSTGMSAPASAEFFGHHDTPGKVLAGYNGSGYTHEFAAQTVRPRITVHPRHVLGPHSVRHCHFWLAKEYRISGPVIVPQQRCWWN